MNQMHSTSHELEKAWRKYPRPISGNKFRHYKGGLYEVVDTGFIEETVEPVVIYRSLESGVCWVRPPKNFFALVTVNGNAVPRFAPFNE